jgi:trimethylamine-N-oxide reductase (cytochrome c) cytochrome c-type subunit TorY
MTDKKKSVKKVLFSMFGFFKTKHGILFLLLAFPAFALGMHEVSIRHFQDKTCVICHEMKEPIKKWKESGTALNHNNCASCHYDAGFDGWLAMNQSAVKQLVEHFKRDPTQPIKPPEEPLFLDQDKEPGYWSMVPNSRCFKCKDAKNHKQVDQPKIHSKLIKSIAAQPCKDCHNHEMRKGQKFFEKVLDETEQTPENREES